MPWAVLWHFNSAEIRAPRVRLSPRRRPCVAAVLRPSLQVLRRCSTTSSNWRHPLIF